MVGTGNDSQKQLLSIICNFAIEKSEGVTLRKQIETLKSELSVANAELEKAKCCKELVEQELKGFELLLVLSEASVQTLEERVSLIHNDMSVVEFDSETLKVHIMK
ncbi:hypothetical protein KIW84_035031 [Lathyrus oleraceus]|uniref:Uncharacterized protein n=1 Tax=Pisum sativum TaxID=3888 RepID=A0A9D4Y1S2_PEA|nr:hypothetical protein KIW84_035031 [Pisum sativum]